MALSNNDHIAKNTLVPFLSAVQNRYQQKFGSWWFQKFHFKINLKCVLILLCIIANYFLFTCPNEILTDINIENIQLKKIMTQNSFGELSNPNLTTVLAVEGEPQIPNPLRIIVVASPPSEHRM